MRGSCDWPGMCCWCDRRLALRRSRSRSASHGGATRARRRRSSALLAGSSRAPAELRRGCSGGALGVALVLAAVSALARAGGGERALLQVRRAPVASLPGSGRCGGGFAGRRGVRRPLDRRLPAPKRVAAFARPSRAGAASAAAPRLTAAALLGIVGVALLVRLWHFNDVGYNSDEAVYAGQGAGIAHDSQLAPLLPRLPRAPAALPVGRRDRIRAAPGRLVRARRRDRVRRALRARDVRARPPALRRRGRA